MPRSRPVKPERLSDGELAELRAQLIDLLDSGWIHWQHSTAGHAAAVVFARKPDGTWRICYDYRGLNAITRPAVEPLPHIDALLDSMRGSRFFTKLDLASSFHQLQVRSTDRWKTSFRSQLGQFEWNVVPFGLQGASAVRCGTRVAPAFAARRRRRYRGGPVRLALPAAVQQPAVHQQRSALRWAGGSAVGGRIRRLACRTGR